MMKIRVTPTALNDLKEIKSYIENDLSNPIAANNVIKRIIEDYSRLEISPHMGPSLSTKVPFDTDYRFIVSGNYLVFYTVRPCGNTIEWADGQDIAPHELYELSVAI